MMLSSQGCRSDVASNDGGGDMTGLDETVGEATGESGDVDACGEADPEAFDCFQLHSLALQSSQTPVCNGVEDGFGAASPPGPTSPLAWLAPHWPAPVTETSPGLVGEWTPLIAIEVMPTEGDPLPPSVPHLPVHSIHRPTGKFLQFGADDDPGSDNYAYETDKVVWYPPSPCIDPSMQTCDTTFDRIVETAEVESHAHVYQEDGEPDMTEFNLFCAGHVNLPPFDFDELFSPRTLTAGGSRGDGPLVNLGIANSFTFTETLPDDGLEQLGDYAWHELGLLNRVRWYPTVTVLSDAGVAVSAGVFNGVYALECRRWPLGPIMRDDECACVEEAGDPFFDLDGVDICDAMTGYCSPEAAEELGLEEYCHTLASEGAPGIDLATRTGSDEITWTEVGLDVAWGTYPHVFVLPDLDVFETSGSNLGGKLAFVGGPWPEGREAILWDPQRPEEPVQEFGGPSCASGTSSVMFASDRILKFGGTAGIEGTQEGTTRLSEVLDLSEPCPEWRPVGQLALPRHYGSGVLLPDGNVFTAAGAIGGNRLGDEDVDDDQAPGFDERLYPRVA
jgi:hypothetical protein